jgi:hypothetical protein
MAIDSIGQPSSGTKSNKSNRAVELSRRFSDRRTSSRDFLTKSVVQRQRIGWFVNLQRKSSVLTRAIAPAPRVPRRRTRSAWISPIPPLSAGCLPARNGLASRILTRSVGAQTRREVDPSPADTTTAYAVSESSAQTARAFRMVPRFVPRDVSHARMNRHSAAVIPSARRIQTSFAGWPMLGRGARASAAGKMGRQTVNIPTVSMAPNRYHNHKAQITEESSIFPGRPGQDRLIALEFASRPPASGYLFTQQDSLQSEKAAVVSSPFGRGQVSDGGQSRAGTVYLDSGVLGRWASQHLEHVLSRVPNGMTGIDPRASSPRGLVSPF